MRRLSKWLICAVLARGATAQAEEPVTQPAGELRDDELLEMALAETVEVYAERPDKPFDRDTELRFTGEQLAARGATDLGSALALIPDVSVRDGGRGGFTIDIRGARKGAVSILIDGVLVSDPYYGTFDISTIPITDIVQIRVATTPQSPLDGPGGPGGVIEVHTRDAVGEQLVIARATGDSLPSAGVSGTARVPLGKQLALRLSLSGLAGARDMQLPANAAIGEQRRAATGAVRIEYRAARTRIAADGFVDDRHYVAPPSEDNPSMPILLVDRETTLRGSVKGDHQHDKLQLQAQGWVHSLARRSRYFLDPAFTNESSSEELRAVRTGAMALATHPIGRSARWAASTVVDRSSADVRTTATTATTVRGDVTLLAAAASLQVERATLRVDAAGGIAVAVGVDAAPWPEGKLVARWRPRFGALELVGTVARKGRVPSLRERFEPGGNAALGPEHATHAELRARFAVSRLRIEAAPYAKRTTGSVRASPFPEDMGMLVNLGEVDYIGIDTSVRVTVVERIEVGGAYNFIRSDQPATEQRLPHHRTDAWVQARPGARVTLLARARYFGASVDRLLPVPAYGLLDFTASAHVSRDLLAVLRIDDVLDARPETRGGYYTPGRVVMFVLQGQWQ